MSKTEFSTVSIDISDEAKIKAHPETTWLMKIVLPLRVMFAWFLPYLFHGYFKGFTMNDIPKLHVNQTVSKIEKAFDYMFTKLKGWKYRLFITLQYCFFWEFFISGFIQVVSVVIASFVPKLMQEFLIKLFAPFRDEEIDNLIEMADRILPPKYSPSNYDLPFRDNDYEVWIYLTAMVFGLLVSQIMQQFSMHLAVNVGMKNRAILTSKIYQKTLKLSNKERNSRYEDGIVLNYVSVDMKNLERTYMMFHIGWTSLITIGMSIYFLIDLVDWGLLTGYSSYIIFLPILCGLLYGVFKARLVIFKYTDKRVQSINEVLNGIKILKFFTWEDSFAAKVKKFRNSEIFYFRVIGLLFSIILQGVTILPTLISVIAFITYYLIHKRLDAITIFTSLAYFNLLRLPFTLVPMVLISVIEAMLSMDRVQKLLEAEETEELVKANNEEYPIVIENGEFSWEEIKKKKVELSWKQKRSARRKKMKGKLDKLAAKICCKTTPESEDDAKKEVELKEEKVGKLHDINLKVKKGQLIGVCGKFGSGKSSLLSAIIGEMKKNSGKMDITGTVSYCSQTGWIQNATLLDNITFGKELNEDLFDEIVKVCELTDDLKILRGGRNIEIGEKGINLSGGQKYRVSLARAVYQSSDIILLDDPLAAVDAHVGRSIFEHCINDYLKEKTRVLVTHQLQYLKHCDQVLLMDDEKIIEMGTYDEIMSIENGKFADLMSKYVVAEDEEKDQKKKKKGKDSNIDKNQKKEEIISKEEKASGGISLDVLGRFIKGYGTGWLWLLLVLFLVAQIFMTLNDWWLVEWGNNTFQEEYSKSYTTFFYLNMTGVNVIAGEVPPAYYYDPKECVNDQCALCLNPMIMCGNNRTLELMWDKDYINEDDLISEGISHIDTVYIYLALIICTVFFGWVRSYIYNNAFLNAVLVLHNNALERILKAPMWFFDTTPLGRIINRFANDLSEIDLRLMITSGNFLTLLGNCIGMFCLMSYATNGWFAIAIPVYVFIYVLVYLLYRKTNIELKRLESISRSPLISHFQETMQGRSTIIAYGTQERFITENKRRINVNNRVFYLMMAAMRWLNTNVGMLGALINGSVSIFCVFLQYYANDDWKLDVSYISLAISYSISLSHLMGAVLTMETEAEVMLNNVERLDYYQTKTPIEKAIVKDTDPKKDWPSKGVVRFENYNMRYRDGLPLVLKDITLKINENEKVGIVGRTGAGKSSFVLAILRLTEPASGKIFIDDVDITEMGLRTLRSNVAIIPQDPVLFSGTLRENLDPFNMYSDDQIWDALDKSYFKEKIMTFDNKLDSIVQEKGENFSVGERQLLCLSRALLKRSKVLILDECTASVDLKTDGLIQNTIREQFKDMTVITIAHRLETIIDSDRVIAMDSGYVKEYDSPYNLITDEKYSIFKDLINETGEQNSKFLISKINES